MGSGVRFVCFGDGIDTAADDWEVMMYAASLRHGMTVPEARQRVKRKATATFSRGGMVLKEKFGYRELTKEEAASVRFGPAGLRIAKLPACTPAIGEMRARGVRRWLLPGAKVPDQGLKDVPDTAARDLHSSR